MDLVKVQIVSRRDGTTARIVPKHGGVCTRQKLDDDSCFALHGSDTGYFKASFVKGKWQLRRRLPDQGW